MSDWLDLAAIEGEWLRQCGPHDFGLPYGCACPDGDPRPVIARLVAELRSAAGALARIHKLVDAAEGTEQAPGPGTVDVEALRPCLDGTYRLVGGAE